MKINQLASVLVVLAAATPAAAQQIVGSSVVNGREVQLMSDSTWRYSMPRATGCQVVQDNVSFCGSASGWAPDSKSGNPDIAAAFRLNDRNFGAFVVDSIGSTDGVSQDVMRKNAIDGAAGYAGVGKNEVETLGIEPADVDGMPGETVIYSVRINGLPFIFLDTIVIGKSQTVQALTYSIGQTATPAIEATHKGFLQATRLK